MNVLPDELLLRIMTFLELDEVLQLSSTCTRLRDLIHDPFVIRTLSRRDFLLDSFITPPREVKPLSLITFLDNLPKLS